MRASHSGELSVKQRTSMHLDDVLELLSSGKVISLGRSQGCEFLLFCQLSDKKGRVAIVSEDRKVLISVQNINCSLPFDLMVPIKSLVPIARNLFSDFLSEKMKSAQLTEEVSENLYKGSYELRVRVVVIQYEETQYQFEISKKHSGKKLNQWTDVVSFFREDFQRIVDAVEECTESPRKVKYQIFTFYSNPNFHRQGSNIIHHRNLVRFLSKNA